MKNRRRASNDFSLSAIIGFGTAISVLALVSLLYALLRLAGVIKLLVFIIFSGILFAIIYSQIKKDSGKGGQLLLVFSSALAVTLPNLFGISGIFAGFPMFSLSYLIVKPSKAAMFNGIAVLLSALLYGKIFGSFWFRVAYVLSAAALIVVLFVLAVHTEDQSSQNTKFMKQRLMLSRLATHDPLTGIGNRRTMEERLSAAVETFVCKGIRESLAILDLDHFKLVNDMFGHDEGDRVLISFSKLVSSMLREGDELFRFGGEEFVALLVGNDVERVEPLMEEIRIQVAENINAQGRAVTTSVGVAYLNLGEKWDDWLKRADLALYKAKACGRNQVVMASPPGVNPEIPV